MRNARFKDEIHRNPIRAKVALASDSFLLKNQTC